MQQIAHCLPTLPGIATPTKTRASWPVWSESTRLEVQFSPVPKKAVVALWHLARDFERQTRAANRQDGAIGRNGLAVLQALIFDFLNFRTGRLDPSYAGIARAACLSVRSVARGLAKLRAAGVLHWLRRCHEDHDELGRFRLRQASNAYTVLPASQWRGYRAQAEPPAPESGTWGDHPPLPDALALAARERHAEAPHTVIGLLETETDNALTRSLARLGRALLARATPGVTGVPAWQSNHPR